MNLPHYLSYLLRLWTVEDSDRTHWCASLESPTSGERLGFNNLEELFLYLEWITQASPKQEPISEERDEE